MFDDPEVYSAFSDKHQDEVKRALSMIWDKLSWEQNEKVLDVGCGTGDATHDVLLPLLKPHCSQLIGVDLDIKMIEFAQSRWTNPTLSFKILNIETKDDPLKDFEDIREMGGFDKIFSFFCLHWTKDRKRTAENLSRLLRPGGQGFILLAIRSLMFNLWDQIAVSEKWAPYFKKAKIPLNEYVYMDDCGEVFEKALTSAGLTVHECEVEVRNNVFTPKSKNPEDLMTRIKTVDPLLAFLPEDKKKEYLTDLVKIGLSSSPAEAFPDYTCLKIFFSKKHNRIN